MYTLECEICNQEFQAIHRRKYPHCQKCAEKLRKQGQGPIQLSRRATDTQMTFSAWPVRHTDKAYNISIIKGVKLPCDKYLYYYLRRFNRYYVYDGVVADSPDLITDQDRQLANKIAARMGVNTWSQLVGKSIVDIHKLDLLYMTDSRWKSCEKNLRNFLPEVLVAKGIGVAHLTKALHRKRPELIPICDSVVVAKALKISEHNKADILIQSMDKLRNIGKTILPTLKRLRLLAKQEVGELTELRILELILWVRFGPFKPKASDFLKYNIH